MNQQPSPPIKEFRARGGIKAAIWRNEVIQNGRTIVQHSVKIQRSYKDKASGEWRTTDYFRLQDLPSLAMVAQEAFQFINLTESDAGGESEE